MPDRASHPDPSGAHTADYGRILELEAERTATSRQIDQLLARRAPDREVLDLVRRQRALASEIASLRARVGRIQR